MGDRISSSTIMNAVAAFAQATGMRMANNIDKTDGLAVRDIDPASGTFVLVEFVEGTEQLPFGANRRVSLTKIRHATEVAVAFGLTPNIYGEREAVVVDDAAEREHLISLLNAAGAGVYQMQRLAAPYLSDESVAVLLAIQTVKQTLLKRAKPGE